MSENKSYNLLAKYYDEFQSDQYNQVLLDQIVNAINNFLELNKQKLKIADLGCGTGIFSLELADMNFSVTALDLSKQMLEILKSKAMQLSLQAQANLKLIEADITKYTFEEKQDVLLAMTDTLNHLEQDQLIDFFEKARQNLTSHGLLIFDLLKLEYLINKRGNNTIFVELDEFISNGLQTNSTMAADTNDEPIMSMVWENTWLTAEQIAISDFTFFEKIIGETNGDNTKPDSSTNQSLFNSDNQNNNVFYKRSTEQVIEYFYDFDFIKKLTQSDFSLRKTFELPERKLFVLQKR